MVWRSYKPVKDDRFWSVSHIRRRYTKPVFTGFPLQLYGYQTLTADLYLHAFPGGYPGIELLNLLGGIIESRETQDRQWSPASKFGFCWNFAHDENVFHHSFTLGVSTILCVIWRNRDRNRTNVADFWKMFSSSRKMNKKHHSFQKMGGRWSIGSKKSFWKRPTNPGSKGSVQACLGLNTWNRVPS